MSGSSVRGRAALLMIACSPVALGASSAPLDNVAAIRSLRSDQAAEARPVHLRGIVTFYDPEQQVFFIQDPTGAIYLDAPQRFPVVAGSRVEVWGKTASGYTAEVVPAEIREVARGPLPEPVFMDYWTAARHENDCRFVTIEGVVRSATLQSVGSAHVYLLQLENDGRMIEAAISSFPNFEPSQLLDAMVRVTGNLSGNFNALNQIVGLQLMVMDSSQLQLLEPSPVNPFRLPVTPMQSLLASDQALFGRRRVLTRGILTLYDQGEKLVIQDGVSNLLVQTRQMDPLAIGQIVDATGFPSAVNGSPALENAQVIPTGGISPASAHVISFAEAMGGKFANDLVSLDAELVSQTREGHLDTLTLRSGDRVFQAVFRKAAGDPDPIPQLRTGSRLRVTGVCIVHVRGFWGAVESFQIHMRSPADIAVLAGPPWWSTRHMLYVILALFGVIIVALAWGLWVRRRLSIQEKIVRQKIEAEAARFVTLARLEQQRSQILELINSFERLPTVFAAIHAHVAEMWPGVSSYSHILKERRLILLTGSHPFKLDTARLHIIDPTHSAEACAMAVRARGLSQLAAPRLNWSRPIISSSGEILGTMTFEAVGEQPVALNPQAVDFGCNLAAIAIDNRRLYEDALHRSKHDQLTGLANRALLDDKIEEALEIARVSSCMAAVLFLDLDEFKQINDTHSHRIGDLYLCEVASRFQGCLRACDTLGRVGGDEFVVVIPSLQDVSQAASVAHRLLAAMHTPVVIEAISLRGSVSIGIAIFPNDGNNSIELKHHADAAMYSAKRNGGDQFGSQIQTLAIEPPNRR